MKKNLMSLAALSLAVLLALPILTIPAAHADTSWVCLKCESVNTESYCGSCGASRPAVQVTKAYSVPNPNVTTVTMKLKIHMVWNMIFSKYNIEVSVNGQMIGSIAGGNDMVRDIDVMPGHNVLAFNKAGYSSPSASLDLYVYDDTTVSCTVQAKKKTIKVTSMTTEASKSAAKNFSGWDYIDSCTVPSYLVYSANPAQYQSKPIAVAGTVTGVDHGKNIAKVRLQGQDGNVWTVEYLHVDGEPWIEVGQEVTCYGAFYGMTTHVFQNAVPAPVPTLFCRYYKLF